LRVADWGLRIEIPIPESAIPIRRFDPQSDRNRHP